MYLTLDTARTALQTQRANENRNREKAQEWLSRFLGSFLSTQVQDMLFSLVWPERPRLILCRQLATAQYEGIALRETAEKLGVEAWWYELIRDFVPAGGTNRQKDSWVRRGKVWYGGRKGEDVIAGFGLATSLARNNDTASAFGEVIVREQQFRLGQVRCFVPEMSLPAFHHTLLRSVFPSAAENMVDISGLYNKLLLYQLRGSHPERAKFTIQGKKWKGVQSARGTFFVPDQSSRGSGRGELSVSQTIDFVEETQAIPTREWYYPLSFFFFVGNCVLFEDYEFDSEDIRLVAEEGWKKIEQEIGITPLVLPIGCLSKHPYLYPIDAFKAFSG